MPRTAARKPLSCLGRSRKPHSLRSRTVQRKPLRSAMIAQPPSNSLRRFFHPRSVAVIGRRVTITLADEGLGPVMEIRYYRDPETGLPHIYEHGVTEAEVERVLAHPGEDNVCSGGSRQ